MFKRKTSLKKITLSELKMLDAQLDCKIQATMKEIKEADASISAALLKSKKTFEEYEQKSIAREITSTAERQRELLQRLETVEVKRSAVLRLISIKETESPFFSQQKDLLDEIDITSVEKLAEESEVRKDVSAERAKILLNKLEDSAEYEQILAVVKSASLDGESVVFAKAEIDEIALKQTL